jgi:ABC-type sugar transport system substrate-binding protein
MLIGFDNDDKLVKFLSDGVIAGLVVQDPFRMGYDGVKTALAASSPFSPPTAPSCSPRSTTAPIFSTSIPICSG